MIRVLEGNAKSFRLTLIEPAAVSRLGGTSNLSYRTLNMALVFSSIFVVVSPGSSILIPEPRAGRK